MWTETKLPGSTAKMNDMMYFSTVRVYTNLMRVTRSVSRHQLPKRSRELYSWNHQRPTSRKLWKLWHSNRSCKTSRDGATRSETIKINSLKRVNWQIIFKPTASSKVSSSKNWNKRSHRHPPEPWTAPFCGWSIFFWNKLTFFECLKDFIAKWKCTAIINERKRYDSTPEWERRVVERVRYELVRMVRFWWLVQGYYGTMFYCSV